MRGLVISTIFCVGLLQAQNGVGGGNVASAVPSIPRALTAPEKMEYLRLRVKTLEALSAAQSAAADIDEQRKKLEAVFEERKAAWLKMERAMVDFLDKIRGPLTSCSLDATQEWQCKADGKK